MLKPKTIFYNTFSKLALLLLVTTVLIVAVVVIQNLRFYYRQMDEHYLELLHSFSSDMEARINAVAVIPRLLSQHATLLLENGSTQAKILAQHCQAADDSLSSISLFALDGSHLASWPQKPPELTTSAAMYLKKYQESGKNFVRLAGRDYILMPARHPQTGEAAGFLVTALNYNDGLIMSSILAHSSENINVFVMDDKMNLLAHNNPAHVGEALPDLEVTLSADNRTLTLAEALKSNHSSVQIMEYYFDGTQRRGFYLYNPQFSVYFGLSRTIISNAEILFYLWREFGLILLTVFSIVTFLSISLTKSITKPIYRLEKHAYKIAKHHYIPPFDAREEAAELANLRSAIESIASSLNAAYFTVISALTKAMEMKDEYTQGHAQRVTELALSIGKEMALPPQDMLNLQYAAILHDIGKLAIADEILLKPGKLTSSERKIIQQHPVLSAEIASTSPFLQAALPGIRHHHERYDGTGYPDGLKGEEIPLLARIIAVADAYDAMTTARPYKAAYSHRQAVWELHYCSGTQFDPKIVQAFLRATQKYQTKAG